MNGKQSKKIRRVVNQKVQTDMEDLARALSKARFLWRLVWAFRVVFKITKDVKFKRSVGR